jgi:DNA-binding NtrC family response regulator
MNNPFILLVDDEIAFVDAIKKRLVKRDLKVISANSGLEALESMKQNKNLDVVILDVKMPGMDGIDTLKEIKKEYPLVEVIMLTAHATVETAIEGMKRGAFDYLMKPCEIDQLVSKVNDAAEKKRIHEEKIREARIKELASRHG